MRIKYNKVEIQNITRDRRVKSHNSVEIKNIMTEWVSTKICDISRGGGGGGVNKELNLQLNSSRKNE